MNYLVKLATLAYEFRKTVVAVWIILAIVLAVFAFQIPKVLSGNGFKIEGEAAEVERILETDFGQSQQHLLLVFQSESMDTDNPVFRHSLDSMLQEMHTIESIQVTLSPYDREGMIAKQVAYAVLEFTGEPNATIEQVKAAAERFEMADESIEIMLTGEAVVEYDITKASQTDLVRAELIGIPAALVILLLAFGGIIAATLPLLIGVLTVTSAMGILYFIGQSVPFAVFILNVVPMIGLALSIDFSLLIVSRYREELCRADVKQAIIKAIETAGHSITISGLAVILGLSALFFFRMNIFYTVAIGGIMVVALSILSAVTLLPALLGLIGENIDKWQLSKKKRKKRSSWFAFALFVLRRPVVMAAVALAIVCIGILPLRDIQVQIPEYTTLPAGVESREALAALEDAFGPGNLYPVQVLVEMDGNVMDLENIKALQQFVQDLEDDAEVDRVESLFTYLPAEYPLEQIVMAYQNPQMRAQIAPLLAAFVHEDKTLINTYLSISPTSVQAREWVTGLESSQFKILRGGKTETEVEIYSEISEKAPWAMAFILVTIFIVLLIAFRSVVIPLKAIIMTFLSLGATFGILVWIFQQGHLAWLLNFEPEAIGIVIPIFIFSLVFCLSIDYEIFLISRIYEVYNKTGNHNNAILFGLSTTSRIITSAGAIMIVITGAFAFTNVVLIKQMGFGIALAIFIDATLIRMILVPATMKLLGESCWWLPFAKAKKLS